MSELIKIQVNSLPVHQLNKITWSLFEVLEVPLTLDSKLKLCLIELTESGQSRHGLNKDLSIAPEWYAIPENFALGLRDDKSYYLNGTQCGFRYIEPQEVEQCIEIGLTADYLISIEEKAKAFKSNMPNIPIQYTDTVLHNAIHQHIPR
jgi:hypothetical protein